MYPHGGSSYIKMYVEFDFSEKTIVRGQVRILLFGASSFSVLRSPQKRQTEEPIKKMW